MEQVPNNVYDNTVWAKTDDEGFIKKELDVKDLEDMFGAPVAAAAPIVPAAPGSKARSESISGSDDKQHLQLIDPKKQIMWVLGLVELKLHILI